MVGQIGGHPGFYDLEGVINSFHSNVVKALSYIGLAIQETQIYIANKNEKNARANSQPDTANATGPVVPAAAITPMARCAPEPATSPN
jgi:hypothetical protein